VNPNLPNIMTDTPPAFENCMSSEVFAKHLNVLHRVHQAFIQSEADEKIRRELQHKIRASKQTFTNGDWVLYKREGQEPLAWARKNSISKQSYYLCHRWWCLCESITQLFDIVRLRITHKG